jgi:hypothetical protein
MQRSIALLLLSAVLAFGQRASPPNEESRVLFGEIQGIMGTLSQITGWKVKHKVPADYISKEQLNSYIKQRLKESVKPEELRIESLTLKMFGLIPEGFDLEKATVDLVTEQAAAFYDYNKKRLFITESTSSFTEKRITLIHELAHALADQQFSLAKYIRKGGNSDDSGTAREAVMEGQATWLMWACTSKLNGGDERPSDAMLDTMKSSGGSSTGAQYPVFENAPLYLRESLVFPYNQGTLFQDAVIRRLGVAGFSEVFKHAPLSSAQILHPIEYFDHIAPSKLEPPPAPSGKKRFRTLADGSMGEFDHHMLLEQYISLEEADRLSPHWRGGAFRLFEDKNDKHSLLTYVSEWDTLESAQQWYGYFKQILGKRNEASRFDVRLDGRRVTSAINRPS